MHSKCDFLSEIVVVYLIQKEQEKIIARSSIISRLSVLWFELVGIWSIRWQVKSEKICGVLLKCIATSQVFLLVFMDDLWFLNLTLNSVEPTFYAVS